MSGDDRYLAAMVPEHTLPGITAYVEQRVPLGDFLTAVFENNLFKALGCADEINRAAIFDIVTYIYNCVPASCHGSPERVKAWLKSDEGGE